MDQRLLLAIGFVGSGLTALVAYQWVAGPGGQYVLAFLMGTFASGFLFTNCTTVLQRSVRPEHVGRGQGMFMLTYYVAAAFSGPLIGWLVGLGLGWSGAGLLQLTLLPIVGLAALLLVDVSKMNVPPSARRAGRVDHQSA
jgi:MFS family permease